MPIVLDHGDTGQSGPGRGLPGLAAATGVETVCSGTCRADRITPGMQFRLADGRIAPVSGIAQVTAPETLLIEAYALGDAGPDRSVTLVPDQHLRLDRPVLSRLTGSSAALVRAGDLSHLPGVHVRRAASPAILLLFREFTLIRAGGLLVEGFPMTAATLSALPPSARADLHRSLPCLSPVSLEAGYQRDLPVLDAREAAIATRDLDRGLPVTARVSGRGG